MKKRPIIIGVTGGIGSGKSMICRIFQSLNVPVSDADSRARWLMNNDQELKNKIIVAFGEESYINGSLNRNYISQIVFSNPEKLAFLNSITHPAVGKDFEKWVEKHQNECYLVKEAALLIESGIYKLVDKLILVTASEKTRFERILKRDPQRSEEEIKNVMKRQMPEEEKRKYCDTIIENDGIQSILPIVLALHDSLLSATKAVKR